MLRRVLDEEQKFETFTLGCSMPLLTDCFSSVDTLSSIHHISKLKCQQDGRAGV